MPQISVIVPARNVEPYIAEALESALSQTPPPAEIIVVDDGSTDRTAEVARGCGPLVTVISQRVNGSGPARNLAIQRSSGDWLAFLDADDIWLPGKLERQLAKIGPDTRLVCTDRFNIGDLNGLPLIHGELQPQRDGDVFLALLLHENFITTSSVLLRRDAFVEAGGFPVEADLVVAQDWDLWMRVTARHPIEACFEPLVKYRLHKGGASRQLDRMMLARTRVVSRALELPKGRALSWLTKRRIWAATHRTNAHEAGRAGHAGMAYQNYLRSAATFPLQLAAYEGLVRVAVGRV
jgi:hypothetical protein